MQADPVAGAAGRVRVRAFDLARGLAIVFMIGVHVLWHWGAPDTWTSPIGQVISFLGGPTAAPVFMFLMGASLAFSSRTSFRSLAVRGLWLLWLGYLLNFLRGVIPAYLGLSTGVVSADQIAPFTLPWLATTVDVHHMAGLSLIGIAALRVGTGRPGWIWLALAALIVATGPFLRGLEFGTPLLDGPLTPVLGGAPNVYYALVPWVAFPLAGAVFGAAVARVGRTDAARIRVFRAGALLGVGLCVAGVALFTVAPPSFDVTTYWRMPPSYFIGITGLVLVWLWGCDLVVRHVRANRAFTFLYGWSADVIAIYFTHWLVVGWGVGVFGFRSQPLEGALIGIVVAIVATALLARFAIGLETPRWLERLAVDRGRPWRTGRPSKVEASDILAAPPAGVDMSSSIRLLAGAAMTVFAVAACSTPAATGGPKPGNTNAPAATGAGQATGPVLAGEACSYFTAEEVGAIVGTVPVSVEERAGRGDCDYFLNADKSAKVNVGFFEWAAEGEATFESTKGFGEPVSVDLGDEAYSVYNESIGTLVLVHAGDSLIVVQAFNTGDQAAQLDQATRLAEEFYNKI